MIKNITIIALTITLLAGTLYHNTTVNTLQDKYDKTCVSSVKKSNRISQLVRQSTSPFKFTQHGEIEQLKDELKRSYDYQIWLHEHSTPVVIGESR